MKGLVVNHLLLSLRKGLRRVSRLLLPPALVVLAVGVLVAQFRELATKNEMLSLTSFIVLISFSALAFNWCRVSPTVASEAALARIYQTGVDLFLASLLALVATFFSWLQVTPGLILARFLLAFFVLHWVFLALSVLLSLVALLSMLVALREIDAGGK